MLLLLEEGREDGWMDRQISLVGRGRGRGCSVVPVLVWGRVVM